MRLLRVGLVGLVLAQFAGCAADPRANAATTVLSFQDLDCSECGDELAKEVVGAEGVFKTAFDKRKAELTVVAAPGVDALALALSKKPAEEGWTLVAGAGKGAYLAPVAVPQGADVKQVAKDGEDIGPLEPHLVAGKITIVEFGAKWCEPCRDVDEHVLAVAAKRSDVAYRKMDVGDWDTPLGARYLKGVKALPYVLVFDPAGTRVDAIDGLDLKRLDQAIEKAGATAPKAP